MYRKLRPLLAAALGAALLLGSSAVALADSPDHGGGINNACSRLQMALQVAPNLTYFSGVLSDAQDCGLSVQAATVQPICPHLDRAIVIDPRLRHHQGVRAELRQCRRGGPGGPSSTTVTGNNNTVINGNVSFNDLSGYGWAQSDIGLMAQMGIFKGTGNSQFNPAGTLSRSQFAALMVRMFALPQPATPIIFTDVTPGSWYYRDAEAAAAYMTSFKLPGGGTAFEPNLPMNRIDVAATLGEIEVAEGTAQLPSLAQAQADWNGFTDGYLVPSGIEQASAVALQMGLMKGYTNGSFGVDANLNRAQAAVLLARVLRTSETIGGSTATTGATYQGTVSAVGGDSVTLTTSGGSSLTFNLAANATVTLNGQTSTLSSLANGDAATVTVTGGQATSVAATVQAPPVTSTIAGTLVSTAADSVTVATYQSGALALNTYTLASGATVTLGGSTSSLGSLSAADAVSLGLNASGTVSTISATAPAQVSTTVGGTLTGTAGGDVLGVAVNGSENLYVLASGAVVTLNGQVSALANLAANDNVTLQLNAQGQVSSVAAGG